MDAALAGLIDRVRAARADRAALELRGGGTKAFYGGSPRGEPLDLRPLAGISSYEPSELVITARGGTPLAELEATLAERGQCLPFEPPHFGADGGGRLERCRLAAAPWAAWSPRGSPGRRARQWAACATTCWARSC